MIEKEEAIELLCAYGTPMDEDRFQEALDMAIKALSADGDLISRKAVLEIFGDVHPLDYNARAYVKQIEELPTYSPTYKPIAKIKIDTDEVVKKVLEEIKNGQWIISSDSAEQTDSYSWCDGCKEYDTEKHCCHRYSSFIRESLQSNIDAVLEEIKAEIEKEQDEVPHPLDIEHAIAVIEKHISGKEQE